MTAFRRLIVPRVRPRSVAMSARRRGDQARRFRPRIEQFEDRLALNYSFGATAYLPVNLETDPAAVAIMNHADDLYVPYSLGPNSFTFYGQTYQSLFVSSNGLITFGSGNLSPTNTDLTAQPTQAAVAPLWADWVKTSGGPMLLAKLDTPNNQLILQWDQVNAFGAPGTWTFEAVLQLNTGSADGAVTVDYLSLAPNFHTFTTGVKDVGFQGGNRALVTFNATNPLIGSGQALQFTPTNPNPPPAITGLSQTSAPEGSSATFVTVTGSNFVSNSTVDVSGSPVATTFQSATQLQAMLPAFALADEGSLSLTVVNPGSTSQVSNAVPFTVTDAPLAATGLAVSPVEGSAFSGAVATFTDGNSQAPAGDFTATIDWGDGHTGPGTVTANGQGNFTVSGTNTYADEGTYPVRVRIADVGGQSASAGGSAIVADAPLSAAGLLVSATEGSAFNGPVADFSDANPGAGAGEFTATIDWGNGQTTAGTVAANPVGGFTVTGNFAYPASGIYPVNVTISDRGGASTSASTTATVADAPLTAAGVAVGATEGAAVTGTVATFTDANPGAAPGDFTATIDWGDGHTSAGAVAVNPAGGFTVTGTNTYAEEGSYSIRVTVTDRGGVSAQASGSAMVTDAALTASGSAVSATEGTVFNGAVATFTDANPNATAADFTATILWGDGQASAGTVTANPDGSFTVSGANTYAAAGSYAVSVSVTDRGGATAQAGSTATVADAPLTATGAPFTATAGTAFNGVVAAFTDANPGAAAADFTATIDWGDGQTSAGTVAANPAGGFTVSGSHTYLSPGQVPVSVLIQDRDGVTAAASTTTQVDPSVPEVTARLFQIRAFSGWAVVLGSFTDAIAQQHTVTVDWGDGTVSTLDLGTGMSGRFLMIHHYSRRFMRHHPDGTTATVTVTAGDGAVSDPVTLAVTFPHHRHHRWRDGD